MRNNIIVLGVNADIGFSIALKYRDDGFNVIGTYRHENRNTESIKKRRNIDLIKCNFLSAEDIASFIEEIKVMVMRALEKYLLSAMIFRQALLDRLMYHMLKWIMVMEQQQQI